MGLQSSTGLGVPIKLPFGQLTPARVSTTWTTTSVSLPGPVQAKPTGLSGNIQQVVRRSTRLSPIASVACISYTNVAVNEIIEGLGPTGARVEVSTIHSFLFRFVVRPYLHLLREPDGQPLVAFELVDRHDEHHPAHDKYAAWARGLKQPWLQSMAQMRDLLFKDKLRQLVWKLLESSGEWTLQPRSLTQLGKKLKAVCSLQT